MAKTQPYHSTNPSDPDVYHDQDDCPPGSQIPRQSRVDTTGGHRRCALCARRS